MLYKKNKERELSDSLFSSPTCEYRGTPFWAWNCKLDKKELLRQIDVLKQMGFGGFHMHCRSGMATPYLGDEFMDLISTCVKKAKKEKMLAWLYDEDRFPSGFGGGFVTKDPENRIKHLLFTQVPYEVDDGSKNRLMDASVVAVRTGNGHLVATFDVVLDENGCLKNYRQVPRDAKVDGTRWYAYLETSTCKPRYNGYTYVNTLEKRVTQRFIEITHEKYKEKVGGEFGKTIPAMFTDEPQFIYKNTLNFPDKQKDVTLPWTDSLADTFEKAYGEDLITHLPELFWELPDGKPSQIRYYYHDHVCQRMVEAFSDTCGDWCKKNNLMLTGHVMNEPTLATQTGSISEAMRNYRSFQLPGIDMLANRHELTTAKQCQSAVHQYGREGMMSELYGVTGWDFDFRGHKLHGDWQAALGVTVRVPHLAWVSMEGEAKRDYPASINYQSSWYQKYSYIEDHFARLNTALTRGKPEVRVGVIHPIESYWLHWGPAAQTAMIRNQMDVNFQNVTNWLLYGTVDFDFICESLLPQQCKSAKAPMKVGEMAYDVIIVPECETLRSTTLQRLTDFEKSGGKLIFMGDAPKFVDADTKETEKAVALYNRSTRCSFSCGALLSALAPYRTVEIRGTDGKLTDNLIYNLRTDNTCKWLFVTVAKDPANKDLCTKQNVIITVDGSYSVKLYNTLNGEISPVPYGHVNNKTEIRTIFEQCDSFLYQLTPCEEKYTAKADNRCEKTVSVLKTPSFTGYSLNEPNAMLLDMAEYSFDGGEWQPTEELLRIDTACRKKLGWTPWGGACNQPWCITLGPNEHKLRLRFTVESDLCLYGTHLALETPEIATITLNGVKVSNKPDGYYVDKAIKTVKLSKINKGTNVLEIAYEFGERTAVEWCYLLGNFGVATVGRKCKLTKAPEKLSFDSMVHQGFPFYGGAVSYHLEAETTGGDLRVTVPQYRGCVATVSLDGGEEKYVTFAPYCHTFTDLPAGKHRVTVTLYLSRVNAFGPIHCCDDTLSYPGPRSYRTDGDSWSYEYRLKPQGVLVAPILEELK